MSIGTTTAVLVVLVSLASGASLASAGQCFEGADFPPFAVGDTWTYLENGVDSVVVTVASDSVFVDDVETILIETAGGFSPGTRNISADSSGSYLHRIVDTSPNGGVIRFSPPIFLGPPVQCIGEQVSSSGGGSISVSGIGTFSLSYSMTTAFTATDQVTVPAGTFDTVVSETVLTVFIFASQTIAVTENSTVHAARYVGAVRQEARANGDVLIRELVAYSVPEPASVTQLATAIVAALGLRRGRERRRRSSRALS